MTIDKIKHVLGVFLVNYLSSLTREQLKTTKNQLLQDIKLLETQRQYNILFKRNIELKFINYLLD